jgi:hypothetical protein
MRYEFVVSGIYNKEPLFVYEGTVHGIKMGEDEKARHNYIDNFGTNLSGNITVVLAIEPKVISFCEMHWIFIGEPSMRHEIIWPSNEALERIADEVSSVMDGLNKNKLVGVE